MTEQAVNEQLPQEPESPKIGPGPALREARQARNLSQEAVAKHLRIDPSLVEALEVDDYSRFAAPIYVTGHLRAYARLLDVPAERFIEAYQNLGAAAPPSLERVARLQRQPETASSRQIPKWIVYVMILIVVLAVALVWRAELTKLVESFLGGGTHPEVPLLNLDQAGGVSRSGSDGALQKPLALPGLPEAAAPSPSATLAVPGAAPAPAASSAPAAAQSPQPKPPAPVLPQAQLSLKADKPSWVEVKDGTGKRLFYDLMVPGDAQSLEGVPPFDVLLGYAPGVTVEYNGKSVDPSPFIRQDMARFRVGDQGISKH